MDNYALADQFSLLAKLMDIHGENSFKSKSYASAAFTLEKLPMEITSTPKDKIYQIKGIGESVGTKIIELLDTGELGVLQEYISKTPTGVLEMMNIKGLGPKKIHMLWKEMQIDTLDDLDKACRENRIAQAKGFGEKTQQNIIDSISFQLENAGKYLYAKVEAFALAFQEKLSSSFPNTLFELTGDFRRQAEIIHELEWVTTLPATHLKPFLTKADLTLLSESNEAVTFSAENALKLNFHLTTENEFYQKLIETSSSELFLEAWKKLQPEERTYSSESAVFESVTVPFIPAYLRENPSLLAQPRTMDLEHLVQVKDIKGLIHSHSNWSDGSNTLEEMADELIRLGFEYLVISDHSKAAFYANGLTEQRIREQHRYIDQLNEKLAPFRIFKSIECDILNDGALDYENKILAGFDLVITSVHSNLDMDENKAMKRLIGAITNPYTTIMGHMTGRLLLRRKGYPVNHKEIIDACAEHQVVIEINASPSRLDMDWRWVDYALEKGVLLSINPDAHTIEEFHNIRYGVLVAQKGGLPSHRNLSSFTLSEFEAFLANRKRIRGIS
ncbi:MAG TPA: helix-hairpin-helix domain-containing protein [Flavisolibacter sp.]|nr:helix-hairpin-helix domain-containing protein [Flavisolibacter sp.]